MLWSGREGGAPCHSPAAPVSTAWGGSQQGGSGSGVKVELPPEPGLRSLCCSSFMVTARSGGKKKGGHWEIPALPLKL